MDFDDTITQRVFRTDVGIVDFERAGTALGRVGAGSNAPDQFRILSALFAVAFRAERAIITDRGIFDGLEAARLLSRMRDRLTTEDIDACWSLLFVLFQRG